MHDPKTIFLNITQKVLTKQVLEILGLNLKTAKGKFFPAKGKPLAKHAYGEPTLAILTTVVWLECSCILLDTHPDIYYAVIFAARYMFCPNIVHEHALN